MFGPHLASGTPGWGGAISQRSCCGGWHVRLLLVGLITALATVLSVGAAQASGVPSAHAPNSFIYDAPVHVYDTSAQSVQVHVDGAALVAPPTVSGSAKEAVATATGLSSVLARISVAADTGTVFSGHGGIRTDEAGAYETTTVPEGTCLAFYCPHGEGLPDSVGNAIETGNPPTPTEVFGPGSEIPNYRLAPPFDPDLNILGTPITVEEVTPLSELL